MSGGTRAAEIEGPRGGGVREEDVEDVVGGLVAVGFEDGDEGPGFGGGREEAAVGGFWVGYCEEGEKGC